ncbi:MAG: hypothetical protein WCL32_19375 [Planctomycetota bacterium]
MTLASWLALGTRLRVQVDAILRGPAATAPRPLGASVLRLVACTLFFGSFYGAVMGSFGGVAHEHGWQIVISAIKMPLLLLATFGLSLPSFFVLNNLLGVRNDFDAALRALVSGQAGVTIVLAALAPYTLLWYASSASYSWALLFNGGMFAIASLAGQILVRVWYRPLLRKSPRHRWLLRVWLVTYVFVGIQMAWILRPFIGDPDTPLQFFRTQTWGNAYVIVGKLVWETLLGR